MAVIRTNARSFNGGEVTPEFWGNYADQKYQTGLALCRNFLPLPHGPAQSRPGTAYVRAAKDSTKRVRLIPFSFSTTQTMVIELGAGYFRFHTMGGTLLSAPNVPYEITNPYAEADLFDIHYVQANDVLTLVHPNYPPRELRRLGALNWQLTTILFSSTLVAPANVVATATLAPEPNNQRTYSYVVTTVSPDGKDESVQSLVATCTNNLLQTGAYNTITFDAVAGATRYNVYRDTVGLFAYVGQTTTTSFRDDNIAEDYSKTPPIALNPFVGMGNYPGAVSYYEQRRVFAGTTNAPQTVFLTKTGTESNLNYSVPTRDDDGISFRIAAREANTIRHVVPLQNLVLLTSSAEFRITSVNSDAITPTSISVKPQSYVGANNVQPVIVNNNLIYAAARGGRVRELAFNFNYQGYVTGDLSLRAPHLFDGLTIVDMAFVKSPQPVVYFVSSNGKLLALTYVPEQQISSWSQHDTDGFYESVTAVAEGDFDALYCVVRRTVNGQSVRYVERFASRLFLDPADAFFVDAGMTYSGAPATTISGLTWLEGKTVNILADGAVHPQRVVTGGSITLDNPASKVQIGLPITADIQTLPMAVGLDNGAA